MIAKETHIVEKSVVEMSKVKDYAQFIKLRLTSLVVFSAVIGYAIGTEGSDNSLHTLFSWNKVLLLTLGGLLVTGASNGFNQIIERNLDKLMDRTSGRPLPQGRMKLNEAVLLDLMKKI